MIFPNINIHVPVAIDLVSLVRKTKPTKESVEPGIPLLFREVVGDQLNALK